MVLQDLTPALYTTASRVGCIALLESICAAAESDTVLIDIAHYLVARRSER